MSEIQSLTFLWYRLLALLCAVRSMTVGQLVKWGWYRAVFGIRRRYVRLLARLWSVCDVELARVYSGCGYRVPWRRAWTPGGYWASVPDYIKQQLEPQR